MEDVQIVRALYETIKQNNAEDYARIIEETASYPYLYHLSHVRQNLIEWLPITDTMHVLERNAECGALTAKLVEMAGNVTAVVEDEMHGDIVRERCKRTDGRLTLVTEEAWQKNCGLQMSGRKQDDSAVSSETSDCGANVRYDVILLAGSVYRYKNEFPALRKMLTPEGVLILADANRLGLKYFAGCQEEYRGGYFNGIEGYEEKYGRNVTCRKAEQVSGVADTPNKAAERCYSKLEYIAMLKEAGLAHREFYYPYPDYKFPTSIYSDRWLPKKGELAENRRNFDKDRLQLFDESKVYDTLLGEELFGAFANSFLIIASANKCNNFETIYAKYSNERAKQFCIRTDIVTNESGDKMVYKYALSLESEKHIRYIEEAYRRLTECYRDSGITFCECDYEEQRLPDDKDGSGLFTDAPKKGARIRFPFVQGQSLQEIVEQAIFDGDETRVESILREYIRRIRSYGGEMPFEVTPEFTRVFGEVDLKEELTCAAASDVDMIFANIFVEEQKNVTEAAWQVIDYEWTFTFPIPKLFILYRAIYFAYYQILQDTAWTLPVLLELAGITEIQADCFKKMEAQFQAYLGTGALPVRNMQRLMGTKNTPLKVLLERQDVSVTASPMAGNEATGRKRTGSVLGKDRKSPKIRKIIYNIDRREYQDGSMICSGWAMAKCWDGTCLPVEIQVFDQKGSLLPAEVERTERQDVIDALGIKKAATSDVGFDCVWFTPLKSEWQIQFSLGNKECIYKMQE